MVREITGVRIEHKSSNSKVMPKVNPISREGTNIVKHIEVKECTSEVPRAENSSEKPDFLAIKATNFKDEKPNVKLAKPAPSKEPSHLTVDKQVFETPLIAVEAPASLTGVNKKSPSFSKKSLPRTPTTVRDNLDDEDNCSITSSMAVSVRTTRSCRTTVGVAPTFSSEDRLHKRKEYYARLEEKRKALEAEKQEYEARTKEEEDAALKKLRKNMAFRASPVPNFYYDTPPPKKEPKKIPTTRAVSPKFARRKSYNDALISSRSQEKVSPSASASAGASASASVTATPLRHSLGSNSHRLLSITPTNPPKRKDQLIGNGTSKLGERSRQSKEQTAIKKTPPKISEKLVANSDITVHS